MIKCNFLLQIQVIANIHTISVNNTKIQTMRVQNNALNCFFHIHCQIGSNKIRVRTEGRQVKGLIAI